jgi:maleate isomerase
LGFEVLAIEGTWTTHGPEFDKQAFALECASHPPDAVYDSALRVLRGDSQGVLIPCTNWRASEMIDRLEQAIGVPVVTATQALLWACMQRVGVTTPVRGYGRLFDANPIGAEQLVGI